MKLSRKLLLLLLFVMILSMGTQGYASQLDKIRERGFLIGAVADFDMAPFTMVSGGEPVGFDEDLIKAIADKIGVGVKYAVLPLEGGLLMAWTKGYDWSLFDIVSSSVTITEERSANCLFSKPYYVTGQMMLAVNRDGGIKNHGDAKGKTLGFMQGSTANVGIEKLGAKPLPFDGYESIIKTLVDGVIDGAVMDGPPAKSYVKANPSLLLIDGLLTKEEFGVGMPLGETELAEIVNQVIDEQKDALEAKWFK